MKSRFRSGCKMVKCNKNKLRKCKSINFEYNEKKLILNYFILPQAYVSIVHLKTKYLQEY